MLTFQLHSIDIEYKTWSPVWSYMYSRNLKKTKTQECKTRYDPISCNFGLKEIQSVWYSWNKYNDHEIITEWNIKMSYFSNRMRHSIHPLVLGVQIHWGIPGAYMVQPNSRGLQISVNRFLILTWLVFLQFKQEEIFTVLSVWFFCFVVFILHFCFLFLFRVFVVVLLKVRQW